MRIIGFSPDGNDVVLEQYWMLGAGASGSGWSELDLTDGRTDQFVGGKPIRIVDGTEDSALTLEHATARAAALNLASPIPGSIRSVERKSVVLYRHGRKHEA